MNNLKRDSWLPSAPVAVFFCAAWLSGISMPANAQFDGFIGRPTAGDYFRHDLEQLLIAARDAKAAVSKFNAQMAVARPAYFRATGSAKNAAGDAFSKLLFEKDITLAGGYIPYGTADSTLSNTIAVVNGGHELDEGIPPNAQRDFITWVRGIRKSLGAKSNGELVVSDQPRLIQAFNANVGLYEDYRRLRDIGEVARWKKSQSSGPLPAYGQRSLLASQQFELTRLDGFTEVREPSFNEQVAVASRAGAKVLRCDYGPGESGRGKDSPYGTFESYYFWKAKAPDNVALLLALNRDALNAMKDHAVTACPGAESAAIELNRSRTQAVVTPEARQQADKAIAAQVQKDHAERPKPNIPEKARAYGEKMDACRAAHSADPPSSVEEFAACRQEAAQLLSQPSAGQPQAARGMQARDDGRQARDEARMTSTQERQARMQACAETRRAAALASPRDPEVSRQFGACMRAALQRN